MEYANSIFKRSHDDDAYQFQVMATMARNLITVNTGLFEGLPTLIIPSLLGLSKNLNPDETLRITASQASWIGKFN